MPYRKAQAGIALVMVLWFIVLLSLLALSFSRTTRTDALLTRNLVDTVRAKYLAAGAIEKGIQGLLNQNPTVLDALISGAWLELDMDGTRTRYMLQDENGKLDINHAPVELIEHLLRTLGVEEALALSISHAVADWRDENDLSQLYGAEQRDYSAAGMQWMPANAPFRNVREMQQVMGVTPEIYAMIAPLITVYGTSEKINPQFASRALLEAIPGIDTVELENYIAARESLLESDGPVSLPLLTSAAHLTSGQAGPVYSVFGVAELASGTLATRRLIVWIPEDDQGQPYFVLDVGEGFPQPPGGKEEE